MVFAPFLGLIIARYVPQRVAKVWIKNIQSQYVLIRILT